MPIYEYQCNTCNNKFEFLQKINDDLLTECPECNQHTLRKLVSAAAFRLKGSGWYETDFKDKKSQKSDDANNEKTDGVTKKSKKESATSESGTASKTTATSEKSTNKKESSKSTSSKATKPTTD